LFWVFAPLYQYHGQNSLVIKFQYSLTSLLSMYNTCTDLIQVRWCTPCRCIRQVKQ